MQAKDLQISPRLLSVKLDGELSPVLLPIQFSGTESLNQCFVFHVVCLLMTEIDDQPWLGKPISICIQQGQYQPKIFHGRIAQIKKSCIDQRKTRKITFTVEPWLALLKYAKNARIFQQQTIPGIIAQVFKQHQVFDFDLSHLKNTYPKLLYCVQFDETDLNFCYRLMQQAGIYFTFKHSDHQHILQLRDQGKTDARRPTPLYFDKTQIQASILSWQHHYGMQSQKILSQQFRFDQSNHLIKNQLDNAQAWQKLQKHQLHWFQDQQTLSPQAEIIQADLSKTIQAANNTGDFVTAETRAYFIDLASNILLKNHPDERQNSEYFVYEIKHHAEDYSQLPGSAYPNLKTHYQNSIAAIPYEQTYRPAKTTEKPNITQPQSAVVVGPKEKEIYTDRYGRIKVQFHWDRRGKKDEDSSCWIRCKQKLSGDGFGSQFIPRVGQEVQVAFINGDPDQPIVTATFPNHRQMPMQTLPANKTISGIQSQRFKEPERSVGHFIHFDDQSGAEKISIHAAGDFNLRVKNQSQTLTGNHQIMRVAQQDLIMQTGGKHQLSAAEQIRLICGGSEITITASGTTLSAAAISLDQGKPVSLPPIGFEQTAKPITAATNATAAAQALGHGLNMQTKPAIVEILYETRSQKFYGLTQAEYQYFKQAAAKLNQPMAMLQQKLREQAQLFAPETVKARQQQTEHFQQQLKQLRETVIQQLTNTLGHQADNIAEVIQLYAEQKWAYVNQTVLHAFSYVLPHSAVSANMAALGQQLKDQLKQKTGSSYEIQCEPAQVQHHFAQWASSIAQTADAKLFQDSQFKTTAQAQVMRYAMGASISGNYAPNQHAFSFKGRSDDKISLAQASFRSQVCLPNREGWRFRLAHLDLGLFLAELEFLLAGFVGASVQLAAQMDFHAKGGDTAVTGQHQNQQVAAGFFAGAKGSATVGGCLQWANPDTVRPPHNQSFQYNTITGPMTGTPVFQKLATISGGATVAAGESLTADFKITYSSRTQVFGIVCSLKAVEGIGFGGHLYLQVHADTIEHFIAFMYHQIKNANFKNTGLFMPAMGDFYDAYAVWVGISTIAMWMGEELKNLIGPGKGVKHWGDWFHNFLKTEIETAKRQARLIHNLLAQPQRIRYAPPETKGYWLYQLCNTPALAEKFWQYNVWERQQAIISILNHIQSQREYHLVLENMVDISPSQIGQKTERIPFLQGERMLWQDKNSVMYAGTLAKNDLLHLSEGIRADLIKLNQLAQKIKQLTIYRDSAYQMAQVTTLFDRV